MSSSDEEQPAQLVITPDMRNTICNTLMSNVNVALSGINLDLKVKINVDQQIAVKIPLTARVTYDEATVAPAVEQHDEGDAEPVEEDDDKESVKSETEKRT